MVKISIILTALLWVSSCSYSHQSQQPIDTNTSLQIDNKVTFDTIKSYSMRSCQNCHSGTQSPALITYSDIKNNLDQIIEEISTDSMPPTDEGYQLLDTCQKALLQKWIEIGSPESSDVLVATIPECNTRSF